MCKLCLKRKISKVDGAPCAVKAACTVLSGGKPETFETVGLPIAIWRKCPGVTVPQKGSVKKTAAWGGSEQFPL